MSWTVRPWFELLAGLARAAGSITGPELSLLVSTAPDWIRIRPAISTTRPPATADPKLVERTLFGDGGGAGGGRAVYSPQGGALGFLNTSASPGQQVPGGRSLA